MFKNVIKVIGHILAVLILTVLTQVGGIIYLLFIIIWSKLIKKFPHFKEKKYWIRKSIKTSSFVLIYLCCSTFIIPLIAAQFGRVPLPVFSNNKLQPLNIMTCILNRHYVDKILRQTLEDTAEKMNVQYPATTISYLDANFPFINGFPLLPHKSHNDGKKIDLAFFYKDSKTDAVLNNVAPSFIGYGVFESPLPKEQNQPETCAKKGYWQYNILGRIVPQWNKSNYTFDETRTKALIKILTNKPGIGKIFIEPHLKTRMHLKSSKIRFHGCGAVRHDDHIHVQL